MASPAQITANRINALASTGPTSAKGKATASQNATKLGLFSKRDFVPDDSIDAYAALRDQLLAQLSPESILEQVLAYEIVSASWRLERCAQIEANFDPAQNEADQSLEQTSREDAIARARTAACRILWKSIGELRKLQNERCIRRELSAESEGLTNLTEIYKGVAAPGTHLQAQLRTEAAQSKAAIAKIEAEVEEFCARAQLAQQNEPAAAPLSSPAPKKDSQIARSAPCPCGSGDKYKRCCGSGAPPKLSIAGNRG